MQVIDLAQERRQRRSERLQPAIIFQLEAIKESYGLECIGIANEEGLFVAGDCDLMDGEVLSAFSPELARQTSPAGRARLLQQLRPHLRVVNPEHVSVRRFVSDQMVMFFFAVGPDPSKLEAGTDHAIAGICRIFQAV